LVVGCLSFSGSAVAFAKLQELMTGSPVIYPGQQVVNAIVALAVVALGVTIVVTPHLFAILLLLVVALVLGAAVVLPVGGADTPVLISLLNSFTGLAVAAAHCRTSCWVASARLRPGLRMWRQGPKGVAFEAATLLISGPSWHTREKSLSSRAMAWRSLRRSTWLSSWHVLSRAAAWRFLMQSTRSREGCQDI
jgi:hypothetical protein